MVRTGRPLKQIFICPVCKDEFTRAAWPTVNTRYKGKVVPRPAYSCRYCWSTYQKIRVKARADKLKGLTT